MRGLPCTSAKTIPGRHAAEGRGNWRFQRSTLVNRGRNSKSGTAAVSEAPGLLLMYARSRGATEDIFRPPEIVLHVQSAALHQRHCREMFPDEVGSPENRINQPAGKKNAPGRSSTGPEAKPQKLTSIEWPSFRTGTASTLRGRLDGAVNRYILIVPASQRRRLEVSGMEVISCMVEGGVFVRPDHLCANGTSSSTIQLIP